jgi:hypothetical protein
LPSKRKATTPSPDWLRRLRDVRGCKRELARIFGEARDRGAIAWADASKAAHILFTITRMIEGAEFERRIEALEAVAAKRDGKLPPRPRHARPGARH